jgi:hypothetical protein
MIDQAEAIRRLTNRWEEQVELYPAMRHEIPLDLYIRRNLAVVMKCGQLADYARESKVA